MLNDGGSQGCEAALTRLVETHQHHVFNLCYRLLGSGTEAEEAVQETFLRAYQHRRRYDPSRPLETWLMAIAAHGCIDRLRRRRLTWVSLADARLRGHPALQHPSPEPEALVLKAESSQALHRLVGRLTPADRNVIMMHYWGYMSYVEIAAATATTVPAVKSRLHRAKRRLVELLRQPSRAGTLANGRFQNTGSNRLACQQRDY